MVVLRAPILLRLLIPVIGSLNYCLSFSLSAYPKPNSFCTSCWSCADKFGMDDELKEIRRRQRERWLAAQAEGRQGGDRDTSAGPTGSATASGSAASANADDTNEAAKKQARGSSNNVVDLTFDDDSDTDADDITNKKKKAKPSKGDDADSEASSDIEVLSPPRKKQSHKMDGQSSKTTAPALTTINSGPMRNFSVGSYNIWFGQGSGGEPHPDRRMEAISAIISDLQPRPLMIGLQEVTPDLETLLYPLLQSMGYHIVSQPQPRAHYYVAIAVLTGNVLGGGNDNTDNVSAQIVSSGFESYTHTIMARGLLWTHVRLCSGTSSREVLFTTTHLESFLQGGHMGQPYDGVPQRKAQVRQAAQFCTEYTQKRARHGTRIDAAIITGDLNWDDERKRSTGNDEKMLEVIDSAHTWTDAWLHCRPGEDGYTYDAKLNDMLRGNLRRRFDRCLVWNGGGGGNGSDNGIGPVQCEMIGKSCIAGLTYRKEKQKFSNGGFIPTGEFIDQPVSPSDHFGIFVTLGC